MICVDKDEGKIAALKAGRMPIYEPGLDTLVVSNVAAGRLSFTTDLAAPVRGVDAIFIAVGTPSRCGDGPADLSYVLAATEEIAAAVTGPTVVVTKSTVAVGTGDKVEAILRDKRPDIDVQVVSNPEFLRKGAAIDDLKRPDRIVIGTDDETARRVMRGVYRPLYLNESPILFVSRRTSELIKCATNAFLATKIPSSTRSPTYARRSAPTCRTSAVVSASLWCRPRQPHRAEVSARRTRLWRVLLPKDTLALLKTAEDFESPVHIVEAVVKVNDSRKRAIGRKVLHALGGVARGKTVALLGLTFKSNTDDMRDAPSIAIAQALTDAGVIVRAYDPEGIESARAMMPDLTYSSDAYEAATEDRMELTIDKTYMGKITCNTGASYRHHRAGSFVVAMMNRSPSRRGKLSGTIERRDGKILNVRLPDASIRTGMIDKPTHWLSTKRP